MNFGFLSFIFARNIINFQHQKIDTFPIINDITRLIENVEEFFHLPTWKAPSQPCVNDRDCIPPYACCNDPFFPISNKFCCNNYKKRSPEVIYAMNYLQQ